MLRIKSIAWLLFKERFYSIPRVTAAVRNFSKHQREEVFILARVSKIFESVFGNDVSKKEQAAYGGLRKIYGGI